MEITNSPQLSSVSLPGWTELKPRSRLGGRLCEHLGDCTLGPTSSQTTGAGYRHKAYSTRTGASYYHGNRATKPGVGRWRLPAQEILV